MHTSAIDLMIRAPLSVQAGVAFCDLERPDTFEPALERLNRAWETGSRGRHRSAFRAQERLEGDPALPHRLLSIDFTNTILFASPTGSV